MDETFPPRPQRSDPSLTEPRIVELCGNESYLITPKTASTIEVPTAVTALERRYHVTKHTKFGVTVQYSDAVTVNLMQSGTARIEGVPNKEQALTIYAVILQTLPNK
jgi:hypothetical protein